MSLRSGLLVGLTALALLVAPTAAAEPPAEPPPAIAVEPVQAPTIAGTARVGSTLSVETAPLWSPEDATTTYQWLGDGEPISDPDAADEAYTLTVADLGSVIAVRAIGTKTGYVDGVQTSSAIGPVALGTLTAVQPPTIAGPARVGSTLSVNPPDWSEADVATAYQWRRNSVAVGAGTQYTLTTADIGATISVRAVGTKPGYETAEAESAATAKVSKIPAALTVTGRSPKVGEVSLSIKVSAAGESALGGTAWVKRGSTLLRNELPITNGQATFSATKMPAGTHTYTVFYRGTTRVASATGNTRVTTKAKAKPSIRVTPKTGPAKVSLGISISAPGQSSLGGTAFVKEGSKTLKSGIKVIKGKATWSASGVKSGSHTYRVGYNGTSQVATGSTTVTVKVPAPVKLVSYANCAAMQKVHRHGVGRSGAKDKTSGKPVTTFLVHTKLYEYNDGKARKPGEKDLDRDNDGVACEKA